MSELMRFRQSLVIGTFGGSGAIDGEGDDRERSRLHFRPRPMLSDQAVHILDVDRVREVAFDRGHAGGANGDVDGWCGAQWGAGDLAGAHRRGRRSPTEIAAL